MHFSTQDLPAGATYKLLAGSVVPRPIALVTSISTAGIINAAPYSFFNVLGADPPIVALGIGNRDPQTPKDTARNIIEMCEFVVNLVSVEIAEAMNICAIDFPEEISEIEAVSLQLSPSALIQTPRISQSPVALECRLNQILEIGYNRIVLGEVVAFYFAQGLVNEQNHRVSTEKLQLIGRMGGSGGYCRTNETFEMSRLSFEEWKNCSA